ncbi:CoA transferase [Amycolatopsis sp. SID8362]|uniref:CaiB/BaiF CoA transferase family protein n=1 Tax=Amycolatopsis sp. SID8362 TaxID=2690346 RepID=UPI00136BF48A|nr:CoA transferase [Amycolatopsis sp. SID8362]NBH08133.1 CoA transferase [Amycolatopsis sp. SID8362]NED44827.1 CoA transferase [Amycolatopsis sp. SID8362]
MPEGFRPLDGIKVVDLSRILAGPYCTQYLGEMGADVVKVEPPGHGDDTRGWGPPFVGGEAVYYLAANRNKRGIVLDLKSDRGREALRRLVADADVLVENFRPGTLEKWGIGYSSLAELNPRLIHVSITGFGQTGPYRDRAGYDLVAQALGGVMSLTGEPDGAPAKVGLPVADLNAGTWAIIAVLMALQARHTTGRGQYLDVSLLDSQLAWHVYAAGAHFYDTPRPQRMGSAHPSIVPYQAYHAADGWLIIAVGSEKLWHAFCGVLDLDIAADPRFSSNASRAAHRDELNALLEPVLLTRTVAEWSKSFDAAGIPAAPINEIDDVYADPWTAARDQVVRLPHPTVGTYVGTGFPVKASDTPARASSAPPTLGQHTAEVLAELGYSAEEIAEFVD